MFNRISECVMVVCSARNSSLGERKEGKGEGEGGGEEGEGGGKEKKEGEEGREEGKGRGGAGGGEGRKKKERQCSVQVASFLISKVVYIPLLPVPCFGHSLCQLDHVLGLCFLHVFL